MASGIEIAEGHRSPRDSLSKIVNRLKARWFDRVKRQPELNATSKCIAHSISNALNCVTLDCWTSQEYLAASIGGCSTKTVQRAIDELEKFEMIAVRRFRKIKIPNRCAPIFRPVDMDKSVVETGQGRPPTTDTDVYQSSLLIHAKSFSTAPLNVGPTIKLFSTAYNRKTRGAIEVDIVKRLGNSGDSILAQLAAIDDAIVDRLCQAQFSGALTEQDLEAAKLAAKQSRINRTDR